MSVTMMVVRIIVAQQPLVLSSTRMCSQTGSRCFAGVGPNSHLENVIVDKNARIGADVHISNK